MGFAYVGERERWRSLLLLLWKRGDLQDMPMAVMQRVAQFSAPEWPTQPLRKLTLNLINTYTGINENYYAAKKKWTASQLSSGGNFQWTEGTHLVLDGRYQLKQQIGHGAFGVVMRALDLQTGQHVAIKIIKAKRAYSQQARREIKLLQDLRAADPEGRSNVVELRGHFVYANPGVGHHECLVFEMLSSNLYTLLEQVSFHGFSLPLVRKFAESLLNSLAFLAKSDVRVIHTDIKPENICIKKHGRSAIKLIDFGSSCREGQQLYSYIQSRYYRSPEVLLGYGYTVAIDTWSLACVLVEMHTGQPLFSGEDQIDQLRKIMQLCGPPPDEMIDSYPAHKRKLLFLDNNESPSSSLRMASSSSSSSSSTAASGGGGGGGSGGGDVGWGRDSGRASKRRWVPLDGIKPTRSLASILGATTGGPHGRWIDEAGHTEADYRKFQDLIERMLVYSPEERLKPEDGLCHSFVTNHYDSHPPTAASMPPPHPADPEDADRPVDMETEDGGNQPPPPSSGRMRTRQQQRTLQAEAAAAAAEAGASGGAGLPGGGGGGGCDEAGHQRPARKMKVEKKPMAPADPTTHISQQHHVELSTALHEIGCPESQLQKALQNALDWDSISELLERFTMMDESALLEARRRFAAFVDQPLRTRRERALRHLLDLLRETGASKMDVEPDLSMTPAP